jgi:glyoxylase I family protein
MPVAPKRIYHVNINCSDLDRSLAFYRDVVGLTTTTRTRPEVTQPGGAFGLDEVQWDAWIMQGSTGTAAPVLDLLEWQVPRPTGTPQRDATATGFNRLCISTPDLDALHARVAAAGMPCRTPPSTLDLGEGRGARIFIAADPDGTQLEFVEGEHTRLSHVAINCADFDRSRRYYEDVMGLTPLPGLVPPRQSGALFGLDGEMQLRAQLFRDPATGFMVELIDWITPRANVAPHRKANELGIFRMAGLTDDIARDYAMLQAAGVECYSPPAELSMGPGLPSLSALFWGDPDGACLELIESYAR